MFQTVLSSPYKAFADLLRMHLQPLDCRCFERSTPDTHNLTTRRATTSTKTGRRTLQSM